MGTSTSGITISGSNNLQNTTFPVLTTVNDAGIFLDALPEVKTVDFSNLTTITDEDGDAGDVDITNLPSLEALSLPLLAEAGVFHVEKLDALTVLSLPNIEVAGSFRVTQVPKMNYFEVNPDCIGF